jgi:hypothetical protein
MSKYSLPLTISDGVTLLLGARVDIRERGGDDENFAFTISLAKIIICATCTFCSKVIRGWKVNKKCYLKTALSLSLSLSLISLVN